MEHITQQSLAFDRADAFEQNEDAKNLLEQEAKLLEEINTFKDALVSAQSDLTEVQRKLRIIRKKYGTHKTVNQIIYDYVKQNSGKRFIDITRHIEDLGIASTGSHVLQSIQRGIIIEDTNGTYSPGSIKTKQPYGLLAKSVIEYAKNNQWFELRVCLEYIKNLGVVCSRNSVASTVTNKHYKDHFEVDCSGKFIKYRLKDQYRSL